MAFHFVQRYLIFCNNHVSFYCRIIMFLIMKHIMTLKDYLDLNNISLKSFGDRCGVSAATILRARDGVVLPNRKTVLAIVKATGGQVTPADVWRIDDGSVTKKETR